MFLFCWHQEDQDFLENMEDFVTLDEVAEDEDEAHEESDNIGTWSQLLLLQNQMNYYTYETTVNIEYFCHLLGVFDL